MFLAIAVILVILWLAGFLAFHITTAAIHLILLVAIILVILHFVRGRRAP
ncbi:lmo0937 family membrane protein [Phenylobacterium sp.]|nr:lmo0937 family membrane protein [Phenylobacterium sp.]